MRQTQNTFIRVARSLHALVMRLRLGHPEIAADLAAQHVAEI
jgi:hypothetical protein